MRSVTLISLTVFIQAMLCSCGSEDRSDYNVPQNVLRISPAAATVHVGASLQFKATMNSKSVRDVKWSVSGNNCNGAECGTVDSNGIYTAPFESPGKVLLSATLATNATKSATAEITVTMSSATFTISPPTATVVVGETQTLRIFRFQRQVTFRSRQSITSTGLASTLPRCEVIAIVHRF
jgi:hypothetical protein